MTGPKAIADHLGRPASFYRSVALERDAADPSAGRSFVLTPWLERGAAEVLSGLQSNSTRRAWRIIGDFGVGKSALALALVQALDPRISTPEMPMVQLAKDIGGVPRMFPLLLTGKRGSLASELKTAIDQVAGSDGPLDVRAAKRVLKVEDPFDGVIALRDALRSTGRFDGLLVVIDEMGKFLEAAGEEEGFDVFRLQALAEAAARSGEAPLCLVLILHKGFQSYAEDWRTARRGEWEKVAERFEEFVFDHPLTHTAALLSAALAVDEGKLPAKIRKSHGEAVKRAQALGWLGPRRGAGAGGAWPLHPMAVPVLARFFATFGQNERSLFGFAASEEPNSLRGFAAQHALGVDLYGISDFLDYVASSFGHRLTSRSGAGEWGRIGAVLDRASDANEVETAILKTIGVLNLLDAPDLAATADSLKEALAPTFRAADVDEAIDGLLADGLIFSRPGRKEFRLWTSRRVDLSTVWAEAESEIDARAVLADLPKFLCGLPVVRQVLARRHSVMRGTSRRFEVQCMTVSTLASYAGHGAADGGLVAIFCAGDEDIQIASAWAAEVTEQQATMLVIPLAPMPELGPVMVDLLRHRWISANAASLQEDAHAAMEIERSIMDLEARLVTAIEGALGLRGHAPVRPVDVYSDSMRQALTEPVHATISAMCDKAYSKAPLVENELVNRHALTTAGAGARQRLIEAMFASAHDVELGFNPGKNPPERALYLSLLRRGNIHRIEEGVWTIAPPPADKDPLRLRPALDEITRRLAEDPGRVHILDIYKAIEDKPLGVRRGLAPLLLSVVLVAAGHRVALFERGTYCTRLDGAAFMRILKGPEHFALQWVTLAGVRADVFHRLATTLGTPPVESGIRSIVDPLIRFGAGLPFHVRHSSELSAVAQSVRNTLAKAHSPIDLIFVDLPKACGCEPFGLVAASDAAHAGSFVERLDGAIAELRACYPRLLETMRAEVMHAFDVGQMSDIAARAASLAFRVQEQQLRTFVMRLSDSLLAEDPWTEALGGAVVGKPPARWLGPDVEMWRSKLVELAEHFKRVEAAAFGQGCDGRNAVRVSLTRSDGRERAVVVDINALTEGQATMINTMVRMSADADLPLDKLIAMLSLEAGMQENEPVHIDDREQGRV